MQLLHEINSTTIYHIFFLCLLSFIPTSAFELLKLMTMIHDQTLSHALLSSRGLELPIILNINFNSKLLIFLHSSDRTFTHRAFPNNFQSKIFLGLRSLIKLNFWAFLSFHYHFCMQICNGYKSDLFHEKTTLAVRKMFSHDEACANFRNKFLLFKIYSQTPSLIRFKTPLRKQIFTFFITHNFSSTLDAKV
jgi:hypothetical protein